MSEQQRPWWALGCSGDLTRRDVVNLRKVNLALAGLMATWVASRYLIARDLVDPGMLGVLPFLTAVAAVPFYLAMAGFLRQADELTRQMQVRAMATGFGAAFVLVLVREIAVRAAAVDGAGSWIGVFAEVIDPMGWMFLAYAVALWRQQRQYGG